MTPFLFNHQRAKSGGLDVKDLQGHQIISSEGNDYAPSPTKLNPK